jgi:hypothetical protein
VAFWASKPAFDRIAAAAEQRGLTTTLWVDDLAISGKHIGRGIADLVRRELSKFGYVGHKIEFQSRRRGFTITGVRVDSRGTGPTNTTNLKIRDGLRRLKRKSNTAEQTTKLLAQLIGLNSHRLAAMPDDNPAAARASRLQQHLRQRRHRHLAEIQRMGAKEAATDGSDRLGRRKTRSARDPRPDYELLST